MLHRTNEGHAGDAGAPGWGINSSNDSGDA
ncbi:MAG: hypothetical protein AW08_00198 [Candidatus Accumulibacter adjunctus]|uniref:Uncharacterized protein n=1 Tax=Candidatus Accumulibacter adjunctus TaxID=1454001 RepID=A0A011NYJ3_9PROT|nr:MAG: hypothetical protein AW08_00198 [Candidatus Accumulibacter adjunctus]